MRWKHQCKRERFPISAFRFPLSPPSHLDSAFSNSARFVQPFDPIVLSSFFSLSFCFFSNALGCCLCVGPAVVVAVVLPAGCVAHVVVWWWSLVVAPVAVSVAAVAGPPRGRPSMPRSQQSAGSAAGCAAPNRTNGTQRRTASATWTTNNTNTRRKTQNTNKPIQAKIEDRISNRTTLGEDNSNGAVTLVKGTKRNTISHMTSALCPPRPIAR